MKKFKTILVSILVSLVLMPIITINASTKTEAVVNSLKEIAKQFNGTVTYEYDNIDISWNSLVDSEITSHKFSYNDSVIEYNPETVTNYEEAQEESSSFIYFVYLIQAALKENGYTEEQIQAFFANDKYQPTYEVNGIEFKELGKEQKFTSEDGTSTITITPMSFKLDVSKANLNTSNTENFEPTSNTVQDIVDALNNDSEFVKYEYEGQVIFERETVLDEEEKTITINYVYYIYRSYYLSFPVEDDVITYETGDITDFDEAEEASSHIMFAELIVMSALKENGYSQKQIEEFFQNNEFVYEINGIEGKETGEEQEFTSLDGTETVYVTPMSLKIDLAKANLNRLGEGGIEYVVLNGENQDFVVANDNSLTFRFSIDYDTFVSEGKVFLNGEEVSRNNYKITKGSTIITFNKDYTKQLKGGNYSLKAQVNDGSVTTNFSIENSLSPNTGDNIMFYVSLLILSVISLLGICIKVRNDN